MSKSKNIRFAAEFGAESSQWRARLAFNEAIASTTLATPREDSPICEGASMKIAERARRAFRNALEITKGALSRAKMIKDCNIQGIRESLEKRFPVLTLA